MKLSSAFTATGTGSLLTLPGSDTITYQVSGTFVGTWSLWFTKDSGATAVLIDTGTAVKGPLVAAIPVYLQGMTLQYYFTCDAFTSGTITGLMTRNVLSRSRRILTQSFKAGTTAGVVVNAGNNVFLTTCPASQTASTAVAHIPGLRIGDTIQGFHITGELTSAGGTVTVDVDFRKQVVTAGVVTDSSLGTMTQISKTANALMDISNTFTTITNDEVIADDTSYYALVTITTGASCTVTLLAVGVQYLPNSN